MLIYPARLQADETVSFDKELPAAILELDEPLFRQFQPVKVSISVTRDGEDLLLTGQLSTVLQLKCGRCADWIEWPVNLPSFILLLEPPFADTIDLTPYVREDILLDLPVAASCRLDTEGRCPLSGQIHLLASEPPPNIGQDAWKVLDKLKVREEEE